MHLAQWRPIGNGLLQHNTLDDLHIDAANVSATYHTVPVLQLGNAQVCEWWVGVWCKANISCGGWRIVFSINVQNHSATPCLKTEQLSENHSIPLCYIVCKLTSTKQRVKYKFITRVRNRITFDSPQDREGQLGTGANSHWSTREVDAASPFCQD
jgi:hypothetical protein